MLINEFSRLLYANAFQLISDDGLKSLLHDTKLCLFFAKDIGELIVNCEIAPAKPFPTINKITSR